MKNITTKAELEKQLTSNAKFDCMLPLTFYVFDKDNNLKKKTKSLNRASDHTERLAGDSVVAVDSNGGMKTLT